MSEHLIIRGAREHNLRNVHLDLPRNAMIVFTGLSGSGKSSLAFDTIFAEGQRRYVESLSAYARQFLGQMDKPDVDAIEGLSPAVSIDQKSTNRNPRSTVGTITEIYDYLRLLYARVGTPYCAHCNQPITRQTVQDIVDQILAMPQGTRFQVLAPVVRSRKGEFVDLFDQLCQQGYGRVRVDGTIYALSEVPELKRHEKHTIEVIIDRLVVKDSAKQRLTDSVETALKLAEGVVLIDCVDQPEGPMRQQRFSEKLACPQGHRVDLDDIEPRSFSFNSPYGACPACSGLGTSKEIDLDLVVPDPERTLEDGAIVPWSIGPNSDYFVRMLAGLGEIMDFRVQDRWCDLSPQVQQAILSGTDQKIHLQYRNRYGRQRSYMSEFEGVLGFLQRKIDQAELDHKHERYSGFTRDVPCSRCQGARLRPEVLAIRLRSQQLGEYSIAQLSDLSLDQCQQFLEGLLLEERQQVIAAGLLKEIHCRLHFLLNVGLNYLTLSRSASSLSGGEAQRIRLATQIGSGLTGVLYVLDEPSIGLHQRDNRRLIDTLIHLRHLGNTLIVVEHDLDTIAAADWIVDIGPRAGEHGGQVVHSGPYQDLLTNPDSITGAYLSGRKTIPIPTQRRPITPGMALTVVGACEHNLAGIDVRFPLGVFTAVTGVSGSGKSTLVNDILAAVLANHCNGARQVPGRHKRVEGLEFVDKLVQVDQSPIGRTPRSNPATYTGVFDKIRALFAGTTEAKIRGYQPGRFSFNVKGGRCEACQGEGTLKIEMNFLPDVYVPCEVCHGSRYNRETLEVYYHGKNIADILDLPIDQAAEFFSSISGIHRYLQTLVDVGLGYVRLGQSATTLSGGEAQRVKLATELQRRATGKTIYILDEPTTGLHFDDIAKLLVVINRLVEKGNTVIVIEHNLDVIKTADWIIDMGPEGGSAGGQVIASGTPEQLSQCPHSYTGQFLAEILSSCSS